MYIQDKGWGTGGGKDWTRGYTRCLYKDAERAVILGARQHLIWP